MINLRQSEVEILHAQACSRPDGTTNLREIRRTKGSNLINLSPYAWVIVSKSKKNNLKKKKTAWHNHFERGVREGHSNPFYFPQER